MLGNLVRVADTPPGGAGMAASCKRLARGGLRAITRTLLDFALLPQLHVISFWEITTTGCVHACRHAVKQVKRRVAVCAMCSTARGCQRGAADRRRRVGPMKSRAAQVVGSHWWGPTVVGYHHRLPRGPMAHAQVGGVSTGRRGGIAGQRGVRFAQAVATRARVAAWGLHVTSRG